MGLDFRIVIWMDDRRLSRIGGDVLVRFQGLNWGGSDSRHFDVKLLPVLKFNDGEGDGNHGCFRMLRSLLEQPEISASPDSKLLAERREKFQSPTLQCAYDARLQVRRKETTILISTLCPILS